LINQILIAGYQGPKSIHTKSIKYFIDNINNQFKVNYVMDITVNGEKASSLIDKTINKKIDISYLLSSYYESILPEVKILDLPYFFNSRKEAYNLLKSDFFNFINNKLSNHNLKLLGFWDNGVRHFSSQKIIEQPQDCMGQILRTTPSPIHIEIFKSFGFTPKPLDVRDFKIAIKDNTINAQENPLTNYWNFEVYNYQNFVTLSSHMFGFCLFVINKDFFESLNAKQQEQILEFSLKSTKFQRDLALNEDVIIMKKMKDKGIRIVVPELKNLNKFKKISKVFHDNYFKDYPHMKKYI
jgi:TRAP-type transport system periplasmic protein